MIEKTYYTEGQNSFKDYVFSANEWSAPIIVSPEELRNQLSLMNLEGRKISKMKMIGLAYNLTRENIEDSAYNKLGTLVEDKSQIVADYDYIDPSLELYRFSEIDEPFLIQFEDGDALEIDTPQEPEFRVSMNCIPWEIDAGINYPNADADILFAPCIGETIKSIEVRTYTTDKDPMYHEYFSENHDAKELISSLVIWLESGIGLSVESWVDFCHVSLIDAEGVNIPINFKDLKTALFNPEDLIRDVVTGYQAQSRAFKFNDLGLRHTSQPYMTLSPENKETNLYISVDDFLLFSWSIAIYTGEAFDEYGIYDFSGTEWREILCIADKIVSFATFDELFEFMKGIDIVGYSIIGNTQFNVMLNSINWNGVDFWKHIELYRLQVKDMKTWTSLVISDNEKMGVYGF